MVTILLMQFLWKYIDDLIGKGLEFKIVLELLWYSTLTLVPMALPLAVLLASMMVTGRLTEQSELVAMNSLGLSFTYAIKPLFYFSFIICLLSFIFSNYTIPYANLKATNLMYDIMHKKLNINIKEKIFFSDIDGYSIKYDKKLDNNTMQDIIIYDYKNHKNITRIYTAKSGNISVQNNNLVINLNNGMSYDHKNKDIEQYIVKTQFEKYSLMLDLSEFEMTRTSSDRFNNKAKTMNLNQLKLNIDSLVFKKNQIAIDDNNYRIQYKSIDNKIRRLKVEFHRKFTLAIACLIMLIIGAPIGSIIKKGGLGLPVVFSIFLFLTYYIISITGEKMVKKGLLNAEIGMWISTYILLLTGLILIIIINNNYSNKLK